MIELGVFAKDVVTGFEGVVTAHCRYLTGCDQYCLAPRSNGVSFNESRWFDESRIQVLDYRPIKLYGNQQKAGGEHFDFVPTK